MACGAGEVCVAGVCWTPCPAPSECGNAKLCDAGVLCVAIAGYAEQPVCARSEPCLTAVDCTADAGACPAGSACADLCCIVDAHCMSPA